VTDSESDTEKSLESSHTAIPTTVADLEEKKRCIQANSLMYQPITHRLTCSKREALWAEFQTSVANVKPPEYAIPSKTVKIEKRYRFAGDEVM
jgi:hypothetical protein